MRKKKILSLFAIILGVMMFITNTVQATQITSVFDYSTITRENIINLASDNTLTTKILGVVGTRESGDSYTWNQTTDNVGNTIWKVVKYDSSEDLALPDYSEFMYCINATRGFHDSQGEMSETKDTYNIELSMTDPVNKTNIINYSGGSLKENFNKVIWIADNTYIATRNQNYQSSNEYKILMEKAGIEIDNEELLNLSEDDIEAIEQMAIWYFTNETDIAYHNENLPGLYLNGSEISAMHLGSDSYGRPITGAIREEKANKLYEYFIDNADSDYVRVTPKISVESSNIKIEEDGDYYIVGPYSLLSEGTSEIKSIEVVANKEYSLLNSSKEVVNNNDFMQVLNNNYYLKIHKTSINGKDSIKLEFNYKYNKRELIYTTDKDDAENTQPVLIIRDKEETANLEVITPIETINVEVQKIWDDSNNQDGVRPNRIKVQLYENGKEKGQSIELNTSNNWKYQWTNLLAGKTYTVKELNSNEVAVENNSKYDANYTVSYAVTENKTSITNTYKANPYFVKILKVGEDGVTALSGAWFKINDGQATLISENGAEIATGRISEEGNLELEYKLEEVTAPDGYIKLAEPKNVKINAKVELVDNEYQITEVTMQEELEGITISEENNVITIKVENKLEITGQYNVAIRKVDENGNKLEGSKFEINGKEYNLNSGEATILENIQLTSEDDIILTYEIKETKVPEGYVGIEDTTIYINAKVIKEGNTYKITRVNGTFDEDNANESVPVTLEGNTIVISVKNAPIEKEFDLALRKFITQINEQTYLREPVVDTSTISTTGTATYRHTKQPIAVQKGDIVTYTIRVYNEGEIDGYVEMITDHLPDNLLPIIIGTEGIEEEKYADEIDFNLNWGWVISEDGKSVTTMKTSKVNSDTYSLLEGFEEITDTKLNAYVEGSDKLDCIDVQIKCLVTDSAVDGEYLTNIAEISKVCDAEGVEIETDRDSTKSNADYSNLEDYKNEEAISSDTNTYIPGQEDDDDFEKLFVKEFDLALRKFITKVNDKLYVREPVVDTSKLGTVVDGKTITTSIYKHTKEPVIVETGDLITYKIRIYNEGSLDGFANEITDDMPEGLEFLPDSSINVSYRWKMLDSEGNETKDVSKAVMITTDYLSDIDKNNIINAVSEQDGVKTLSYKDVEVQFKVIAKAEKLKDNLIINEAQISSDSDRDIDSIPNRDEKYDYNEEENNEDDIDYEPIKLQYFDLALRKFITKVNTTNYNNRYPEIVYGENESITYKQTKDPVLVTTGDTVVYTIRVYNEGEKSGTAIEITDNIPEGLEFLPENEINKKYGWILIDESGNATEDISKAVKISTKALEKEVIDGIIIEEGQKVLSYKDVQIAFKVTEKETSDRILVNTAEISGDNGDDIDSTPDNKVETEDDLDKEYVKVQYFDLALKKWVTSTKVTYNGKTTTTKTGFTEDSEGIAKVDLVASKMKKTTVKFTYNIKVINEGELPGYAYEVKDYIPKGLEFIQEDNKDWKEIEDGVVVTDKLKDTLLNPGESAVVEITLTWKNSTTNLALKTNYAEISNDSGNDIDSVPDNFDKEEDDIDDAQVILSIKTAGATTYVGLILTSVSILAVGIFLIKKYVIR